MSMLQTDSVNRPNAKLVFDSISCHKCKNTAIHSTKEMSKVVPKGMILWKYYTSYEQDIQYILCCVVFCFVFLRLVYLVSLDCPFLIGSTVYVL